MSEPNVTAEFDIQENVLLWTSSVSSTPIPEFENKRRRPPDKHPLLIKLLEAENEDWKHGDYTAHLLIQRQAREYAFAVEDVLRVLKSGIHCVNQSDVTWRGDNSSHSPGFTVAYPDNADIQSELTQIGRKIVMISEAVKRLQGEDALTFWTSQQRSVILQELVSFSRDAVKLRRKLARIKGSVEDRVKNVRRVAIKCECEITGNLVPSEIYYQWGIEAIAYIISYMHAYFGHELISCLNDIVKEDAILYKDSQTETANVSLQNLAKVKEKISALKSKAMKLVGCGESTDSNSGSESELDEMSSLSTCSVNMPVPGRVYQIDKHIEILHKIGTGTAHEEDSVCEVSLKNAASITPPTTTDQGNAGPSAPVLPLDNVWAPKPSQKCLETIASNVAPPQKFTTNDFVYDQCESRIKEIPEDICPEYALSDEVNNQNNAIKLNSPLNSNVIENHVEVISAREVNESPETKENVPPATPTITVRKLLSASMQQEISLSMNAINGMRDVVTRITYAIRAMEREWVSPETMIRSIASGKEFYQLVDFIVETAKLTQDPAFASRIYPEDKNEILSVLDPVLRELTNCFMSLHAFHNLVAVDVQYLKELVSGFPKGNLVIRDWVSDPSIDEELAEIEQPNTVADFDFDVDELFE